MVLQAALQRMMASTSGWSRVQAGVPRRSTEGGLSPNDSPEAAADRLLAVAQEQATQVLREAYAERARIRQELVVIIDETRAVVHAAEEQLYARFCALNERADQAADAAASLSRSPR